MRGIGFRTTGFRNWKIGDAFKMISQLGYTSVELCLEDPQLAPKHLDDQALTDLAEQVQQSGLKVAAVSFHGGPIPVPIRVAKTFAAVKVASKFPSKLLIFNTERVEPGKYREQYDILLERIDLLLKIAGDYSVTLAIEPEPDLIISTTQQALQLLKEIDSSKLTVNLDVGHSHILGENVPDSIRMLEGHLGCVHIDDMKNGKHEHLIPGQGEVDLRGVFAALEEIGYTGECVVDIFNIQNEPVKNARECIRNLVEIMGGQSCADK